MASNEYKYIRAWGMALGSHPSYIQDQIAEAKHDKAPFDATFKRHHPLTPDDPIRYGKSNEWARFGDMDIERQRSIQRQLAGRNFHIDVIERTTA